MGKIIVPEEKIPVEGAMKTDWAVIQCSDGCDPDGHWYSLHPQDVPKWVTEDDCISKLMEGKMVCMDPENNAKWYRAVKCDAPKLS